MGAMMGGRFRRGDPEELPWIKLEPSVPIVTAANIARVLEIP